MKKGCNFMMYLRFYLYSFLFLGLIFVMYEDFTASPSIG